MKLFALSTVKRLAKFHTAAEGEKRLASNSGWAAQLEAEVAAGGDREFGARRAAALGLSRFADEVRDLERLRASAVAVGLPGTAETVSAEILRFRGLMDRFEALAGKPWAEEPAEAPAAPAAEEPAPVPVCATCGGPAPDHVWEPGAPSPCCAACEAAEIAAVTEKYAAENAAWIAAEDARRAARAAAEEKRAAWAVKAAAELAEAARLVTVEETRRAEKNARIAEREAARAEKSAGFATVEEALAAEGLRLGPGEAGWYVFVLVAGESLKVWATDLPAPETAPAPAAEEALAVVAAEEETAEEETAEEETAEEMSPEALLDAEYAADAAPDADAEEETAEEDWNWAAVCSACGGPPGAECDCCVEDEQVTGEEPGLDAPAAPAPEAAPARACDSCGVALEPAEGPGEPWTVCPECIALQVAAERAEEASAHDAAEAAEHAWFEERCPAADRVPVGDRETLPEELLPAAAAPALPELPPLPPLPAFAPPARVSAAVTDVSERLARAGLTSLRVDVRAGGWVASAESTLGPAETAPAASLTVALSELLGQLEARVSAWGQK